MSPDEVFSFRAFQGAVACGLLALVAPWIALWFKRWAAAAVAGVLAFAGTILEFISDRHMSSNVDIRVDLVIILPLLLLAWLECFGLACFAALKNKKSFGGAFASLAWVVAVFAFLVMLLSAVRHRL